MSVDLFGNVEHRCLLADRSDPRDAVLVGAAGEHLVALDLLLQDVRVSLAAAGSHYDLIADDGRGRLARVQVKSTVCAPRTIGGRTNVIRFGLRRGKRQKGGRASDHADVLAFAFLRSREVAYIRASEATGMAIEWRTERLKIDRRGHRIEGSRLVVSDFARFPW